MTDAVRTASDVALQLLLLGAVLSVLVLLVRAWRSARRFQLVVAELVNSTADAQIDPATPGLTQLTRQRVDAEVRIVARRREVLHAAVRGGAAGARTRAAGRVQQRIDDSLGELLSVAREVVPSTGRSALTLLAAAVARPRGLLVSGILQRRGPEHAPRLGLSLDVQQLAGQRSVESQTFWEPAEDAGRAGLSAGERLIALLGPAARWAAIELVLHSVFPREPRGGERGLDHLLRGVLHAQSAGGFPAHAPVFRRRAAEELEEAAEQLAGAPLQLAALADTLDRLAAAWPEQARTLHLRAHEQYARTLEAMERERGHDPALLETYRVRQATSWLASGMPEARARALRWLETEPPSLDRLAGAAAGLYDAACLYALAAEAGRPDFGQTARELLARATERDPRLVEHAARDPQLASLRPGPDSSVGLETGLSRAGG